MSAPMNSINAETLYLIAHKVRGQPAFDVAIQMECPHCHGVGEPDGVDYEGPACDECSYQGYWWILPSTGHRAYPYMYKALDDLCITRENYPVPDDLRDFWNTPDIQIKDTEANLAAGRTLLETLGLLQPSQPFVRRV